MCDPASLSLTVIIPTLNEAIHIRRALASVRRLGAEAIVLDSFSTDDTVSMARDCGARVVQHAFVNYAQQFQWALDHLPITTEWVMRLDADEELTDDLVTELIDRLPALPEDVTGINLKRRHMFLGRWIKHGGRYPLTLLRVWRRGAARIEQRWMDEHMVLLQGRAVTFKHDFCDNNLNDLTFFTSKHNGYATREAIDVLLSKYALAQNDTGIRSRGLADQTSWRRNVKERLYNALPVWMGPLMYFLFRYIFQFGFLDGKEGATYHLLQGLWYRFLVGLKVMEYNDVLRTMSDPRDQTRALAALTGKTLPSFEYGVEAPLRSFGVSEPV